jgi:hypothetical protein
VVSWAIMSSNDQSDDELFCLKNTYSDNNVHVIIAWLYLPPCNNFDGGVDIKEIEIAGSEPAARAVYFKLTEVYGKGCVCMKVVKSERLYSILSLKKD